MAIKFEIFVLEILQCAAGWVRRAGEVIIARYARRSHTVWLTLCDCVWRSKEQWLTLSLTENKKVVLFF